MTLRRERGKLLNEEALARLESATRAGARSDSRITQEQMAELWGVDTRTVRRILSRRVRVDIATLMEAFSRVGLKLDPRSDLHSDRLQFPDTMPLYATRLIGRESEIEELSRYLRAGRSRIVCLTGIGGIGKTRLAVEVARNLASDYLYAVWFAPIIPGSERKLVSDLIRRLGLSPYLSTQPLDTLAGFLNNVGGPILLILDDFQVGAGQGAEALAALLQRVPTLQIVITSRHDPVDIAAPHLYRVLPLSRSGRNLPSGGYVTGPAMRHVPIPPAVALFVETVQAAKPDFRIGPESLEAIAALCERIDRIPLAITLVAGWMMSLDRIAQIQGRLEGEGLLRMSEVLDETYELLDETLRTIFRRLAIFREGWTLEAAEAVCDSPSVSESLDALKAWSLLVEEQTPPNEPLARLRMFPTLSEYGESKLPLDEKWKTRRRHLQFFSGLAEDAYEHLHGPDQMRWLQRLEADHGNLCAAMEYCLSEPDTGEEALRLVSRLCDYFRDRGYVQEGSEYVARALHHPGAREHTGPRGDALYAAGTLAVAKGEYAQAYSWYQESIAIRKSLGDRLGCAEASVGIGLTLKMQSRLNEARAYYKQSLILLRAEIKAAVTQNAVARAKTIQARLVLSVGRMCEESGRLRAAYTRYNRCLQLNREVGNRSGIAAALLNLGNNLADRGDPTQATQFYLECKTQYQSLGNRRGIAEALNNLGVLSSETGESSQALVYFEESIRLKHEIGDVRGEANSWCWLSEAKIRLSDFVAAQKALRQSLILSHRIGAKDVSVRALFGFAVLAYAEQDRQRAAILFSCCGELRRQLGVRQFPRYLEEQAQIQKELAAALGDDYARAVSEGSGLTLDEAIDYALTEVFRKF